MIFKAGEKPGRGIYYCTRDFYKIILNNEDEFLPFCPNCNNSSYIKIG